MLLNARKNSFLFLFPKGFFSEDVQTKYKDNYLSNLLLPYDDVESYMSSTIQSVRLPGWELDTPEQTRPKGAKQEFKPGLPVKDYFERTFTVDFQLADGFLNYFIFLENAIQYLNFKNEVMYFPIIKLGLINNEGYLVAHVDFLKVILKGMSDVDFNHADVSQSFSNFTATFQYMDWRLHLDYGTEKSPNKPI